MAVLQVLAQGHHGFPQPEDDYYRVVYGEYCLRCGRHGAQVAPFRFKRAARAPHSSFMQLNWVFDAFFVHPEVAADLAAAGISGIAFGPVLDHRTGVELTDRRQLLIATVLSCAETSRLPQVTCRPDNEESGVRGRAGRTRYTTSTPFCGGVKHHQPTSLAVRPETLRHAPDLLQTAEWFGSGGLAERLTLCSERFAELVTARGWRGLVFRSVRDHGWSERMRRRGSAD